MDEVFRNVKIKGYTHYQVSNTGKVLNTKTNKYLSGIIVPNLTKGFVRQVLLHNKNICKSIMVHKLVFMHFKKEEITTNWIWHNDLNGLNNNEPNLSLNTRGEYKRKCAILRNKKRGVYSFQIKYNNKKYNRYRAALKVDNKVITLGYTEKRIDSEILYEFGYQMIYNELPYKKVG